MNAKTEQRLFLDAEVQTKAECEAWRAHVERVNDARLAKGHIRPARRHWPLDTIAVIFAAIFAATTALAVLLDPEATAKFIGVM